MSEFKSGDLVMLKSGGPRMTVEGTSGSSFVCSWFDKQTGELKRETFMPTTLTESADNPAGSRAVAGSW